MKIFKPRGHGVQNLGPHNLDVLSLSAGEFFLAVGWRGGSGKDAEDFVFFHDDEVFAVNLDLGAGILAEQDAVVFMNCERESLALIVGAALAGRDDDALLWFVFCAVGDDDSASGGGSFLHATYQDAVMQWAKFSHGCNSFQKLGRRLMERETH